MGLFNFGRKNKEELKKVESKPEPAKQAKPEQPKVQTYGGMVVISYDELQNKLRRGNFSSMNMCGANFYTQNWYGSNMSVINNLMEFSYQGKRIKVDINQVDAILLEDGVGAFVVLANNRGRSGTTSGNNSGANFGISGDCTGGSQINCVNNSGKVITNNGQGVRIGCIDGQASNGRNGRSGTVGGTAGGRASAGPREQTFELDGITTLQVNSAADDVVIDYGSGKKCKISSDGGVNAKVNGSTIVVECNDDVEIELPSKCAKLKIKVNTASGDVNINNIECNEIQIGTASGDVDMTVTTGDIKISTASGDVSVSHEYNKDSDVKISTASGDITYCFSNVNQLSYNVSGDWDEDEISTDDGDYDGNVVLNSSSGVIEFY